MTLKHQTTQFALGGNRVTMNTSGSVFTNFRSQNFAVSRDISGGTLPDYRRVIMLGGNATTVLSVMAQNLEVNEGSFNLDYFQNPVPPLFLPEPHATARCDLLVPFEIQTVSPTFDVNTEYRAIKKLYGAIKGAHQKFSGGVFIGEIHQTVSLILNPLKTILRMTGNLLTQQNAAVAGSNLYVRSGGRWRSKSTTKQRSAKASLRKKLAGNYLTYVFGIIPLVSDIESLSKALQSLQAGGMPERFTASAESLTSGPIIDLGNVSDGPARLSRQYRTEQFTRVKFYGAFKPVVQDTSMFGVIKSVSTTFGLNIREFVPTVWNLIPLSFVADYVVNIGDMLDAATTDTSTVAWLAKTVVTESRVKYVKTLDAADTKAFLPGWNFAVMSGSPGGYTLTTRSIQRAAATMPFLTPRFNIENSPGRHLANLVALLVART